MPSLDAFAKSLIEEHDKLIQMGVLNASKNQALLVGDLEKAQTKWKQKGEENKNVDSKSKEKHNSSDGASGSKKNKNKKFEKAKCSYCMRGFHLESQCMKKTIDQLQKVLGKNNNYLPQNTKNYESIQQAE